MRRSTLTLFTALCLLLAAQSASAKDTWTSVRSQNFHLVGNASEKDIRQVATRLEQFRLVFSRLFTRARLSDSVPTTVIVFKNEGAYRPFNPRNSAGYFQPGEEVNYITLSAETRGGGDNTFAVIFHEYVHLLVKNNVSPHAPAWVNEGLAEFYSTLEVAKDRKAAHVGKPIADHILYLRQQKLLPLRTLFAVDHSSPHYNEQSKRGVFYAQSWALVHYLMLGKERQRQPQLNRYLELVARGVGQQQSFQTAFGADAEAIEKELRDYIHRNTYPYVTYPFEQKLEFDSALQSAPLAEAEALAYLGDLALHSPGLLDLAETQLQKSVALDAGAPMAQASLGMLRMRQRRFAEAKEHLRRAVASDARNHLAHYYYAYTLSREAMGGEAGFVSSYEPKAAEEMRAALKKAIELKPDFAGPYSLLAFINMVTGEQLDEGIELLNRAIRLAPGEERFYFDLAQLYMRKQDFDSARKIAEPLAEGAPDPQVKANARSLLNSIRSFQEQVARFNSARDAGMAGGGRVAPEGGPPRLGRRARPDETGAEGRAGNPGGPAAADGPRDLDDTDTIGMSPEEALALAIREAMRQPQAGETRVRGVLVRIECGAKGLVFVVKDGERLLRLGSSGFEGLHIMAFTPEAGGELTCGARKTETAVVATFRAASDARAKTDGAMVALEFVPLTFRLKE